MGLAERVGAAAFRRLMNRFYTVATDVLLRHDALVDKFVGDEVIGLFVPAFVGEPHAQAAIDAGRELLRATRHADPAGPWLPAGVGVHTSMAFVGSVGTGAVTKITALGDVVNTTARLASVAGSGELLVTEANWSGASPPAEELEQRRLALEGREELVDVRVLRVSPAAAEGLSGRRRPLDSDWGGPDV